MANNLTIGDYVTTCYSHPIAINSEFEIEKMELVNGIPYAYGRYGGFPITLLKRKRKPNYKPTFTETKPKHNFYVGEKVNHPQYGIGEIIKVNDTKNYTIEVLFESGKTIKLVSSIFEKIMLKWVQQ